MSRLIKTIDLTDSFFDELEKSKLTFDYERMKYPSIVYKGRTYYSVTRIMKTAWCGDNFGNTLHGKMQKKLMYKLVFDGIIEECNEMFSGGLVAIRSLFAPEYEEEPGFLSRKGIFMRYAKLIPSTEEIRCYNEKKELEKYRITA